MRTFCSPCFVTQFKIYPSGGYSLSNIFGGKYGLRYLHFYIDAVEGHWGKIELNTVEVEATEGAERPPLVNTISYQYIRVNY